VITNIKFTSRIELHTIQTSIKPVPMAIMEHCWEVTLHPLRLLNINNRFQRRKARRKYEPRHHLQNR